MPSVDQLTFILISCLLMRSTSAHDAQVICEDGEQLYWLKKSIATHSNHQLFKIEGKCRKFEDCSGDCWWAKNGCESDIIPLVTTSQKETIYVAGVRLNTSETTTEEPRSLQYELHDCVVKFYSEDQPIVDMAQIQQDWRRFGFGRTKTAFKDITVDDNLTTDDSQFKLKANVCKAKAKASPSICPDQSESIETTVSSALKPESNEEIIKPTTTSRLAKTLAPLKTSTNEPLINRDVHASTNSNHGESCKLPSLSSNSVGFVDINNLKVNSSSFSIGTELALICDEGWVTGNSYYQVIKCVEISGKRAWIPSLTQPCSVVRTSGCCITGQIQWKFDSEVVNCAEDTNVVNTCRSEFTDCNQQTWTCAGGFWSKDT